VADVDELQQQVWLHPEDDQLRLVLADALISVGDPRGELIQLQLQSPRDHSVRIMRLIQSNGMTWLGALRGAVIPLGYERGFLASCRLYDAKRVEGVNEWSTVHTVDLDISDASILAHPVMRSLRCVINLEHRGMEELLAAPHAVQLERLCFSQAWSNLPKLYDQLKPFASLSVIELDHPLPLVLKRGADERLSVIECEFNAMLIDVLRRIPIGMLTRLAVTDVPEDQLEGLQTVASRQRRMSSLELIPYAPLYNY
jgi:uncharacterized protein (TIGR02996 family)